MLKISVIWINRLLWTVLLTALIAIAAYVSIGRYSIGYVEKYQRELLEYLVDFSELSISVDKLSGRWQKLSPIITLQSLKLYSPVDMGEVLSVEEISFQIDLLKSIASQSIQVKHLGVSGIEGTIEEKSPGKWQLKGYDASTEQSENNDIDKIIDLVLSVDSAYFNNATINLLFFYSETPAVLDLGEVSLSHAEDYRRVRIEASFDETRKPLLGIIESQGDPRDAENFHAKAYLKLDDINFKPQLPLLKSLDVDVQEARLASEIWLDWQPGREISIQGDFDATLISWVTSADNTAHSISDVRVEFRAEKASTDNWEFWVPIIRGEWNDKEFKYEQLRAQFLTSSISVSVPLLPLDVNLQLLTNINTISESTREILATLNPRGNLRNLHLIIDRAALQPAANNSLDRPIFQLYSNVDEIAISPWKGAPGAKGVKGYLEVYPDGGLLDLDAQSFEMSFPGIYEKPLDFTSARGQLRWSIDATSVKVSSGPLYLTAGHGPATALLGLNIPLKADPLIDPIMNLIIGLRDTDAKYRNKFIPTVLNKGFRDWMASSLPSGNVVNGGLIYRGSLLRDDSVDRTVQLFFDVEDAVLDYHPQWPSLSEVDGLVSIDDSRTIVSANVARLSGLDVESAQIQIDTSSAGDTWLSILATANGSAENALKIVNESALRDIVGATFESWEMTGLANVEVNLGIPLGGTQRESEITVNVLLSDAALHIPEYRVKFNKIDGPINYTSAAGIHSPGISGALYQKPVKVTIKQTGKGGVAVDLIGKVDIADIESWSRQSVLGFAQGVAEFNARVAILPDAKSLFTINSNLSGVGIDLPKPYGKSEDELASYWLQLPLSDTAPILAMGIRDRAELQLQLNGTGVKSGLLRLENDQSLNALDYVHEDGSIVLTGEIENFLVDDWFTVFDNYQSMDKTFREKQKQLSMDREQKAPREPGDSDEQETLGNSLAIRVRELNLVNFNGFQQNFNNTRISASREAVANEADFRDGVASGSVEGVTQIGKDAQKTRSGWFIEAENDVFEGHFFIPDDYASQQLAQVGIDTVEPLTIHLTRLNLPESNSDEESSSISIDPTVFENFSADIMLDALFSSEQLLGDLAFSVRPFDNGLRVSKIRGNIRGVKINADNKAKLDWWRDELGDHSQLIATLDVEDIGDVLENWKYERILESDSGRFVVDLNWPGDPSQWQLRTSEGSINIELRDGRFLNATNAAEGALKVVSVVNLTGVLRSQSIFSDVFDSGVSFERIDGLVNLADGDLSISEQISVSSSSSDFGLSGVADMDTRNLDMELVVTMPLANNLPWLAVLAGGGLPVAAGIFVVGKIFEKQVDKFSSAVYTIDGDWDKPAMELNRVFGGSNEEK